MIVVDSNVVSGLMRPSPERAAQEWVHSHEGRELCTTAITVAEILSSIERLPEERRKEVLRSAAAEIFEAFAEQVLPFDTAAAEHYAWW
jgi:toxin FitB